MRGRTATLALVAWLCCAPAAQAQSESDKATAASLADRALDRYEHGEYKESLDLFAGASALVRAPSFAVYEARCLTRLNRLPEAEAAYERAIQLDSGPTATPVQQKAIADARAELAELRRRREQAAGPRVVNRDGAIPQPASHSRGPGKATLAVLGVGAAGLVVGVTWGALMLSHKSTLDGSCTGGQCPASQRDEVDSYHSARLISTVGWGVGLLGVGLGAGMWIGGVGTTPQSTGVRFQLGPTGVQAVGSFLAAIFMKFFPSVLLASVLLAGCPAFTRDDYSVADDGSADAAAGRGGDSGADSGGAPAQAGAPAAGGDTGAAGMPAAGAPAAGAGGKPDEGGKAGGAGKAAAGGKAGSSGAGQGGAGGDDHGCKFGTKWKCTKDGKHCGCVF
jgi:hypothetical protein